LDVVRRLVASVGTAVPDAILRVPKLLGGLGKLDRRTIILEDKEIA